jgi:rRNA-processing protein FCF1
MTKAQNSSSQEDPDIFIANHIYPDAKGLLGFQVQPLESIKDDCLIVLDTNVLLLPYNIGRESLKRIEETYRQLVNSKRLIVPGQVVREFAKNRANKLSELFQQIARKSNVSYLQKGNYPLLELVEEYQKVIKLEQEIDTKLKEYQKAIRELQKYIQSWTWNDPVSVLYANLFQENVIFDLAFEHDTILKDLKYRQDNKIPPGYKDSSKDDKGVGDLLIWHTILELGRKHKSDIVFVTGDEKADWYHQSEKQALYPRFELIDEFRRTSEGRSFHIVSFSKLLDLFGASSEIVKEVHQQEAQERFMQGNLFVHGTTYINKGYVAEMLVAEWLKQKFPKAIVEYGGRLEKPDYGMDIIALDDETGLIGVQVKYFTDTVKVSKKYLERKFESFTRYIHVGKFGMGLLVLITNNLENAIALQKMVNFTNISTSMLSDFNVIVGYIDEISGFKELPGV